MKSYAEVCVFHADNLRLYRQAQRLFEFLPDQDPSVFSADREYTARQYPHLGLERAYRCHEVARAFARVMRLPDSSVQDGWYGTVDHTWLWLEPHSDDRRHSMGTILDVYAVGRMPPVQLVSMEPQLGHYEACGGLRSSLYRESRPRSDIRQDVVDQLVQHLEGLWMIERVCGRTGEVHHTVEAAEEAP